MAYGINFIDVTGAEMLVNESRRRRALRGDLYLCGLKSQARNVLERGGYIRIIGRDHIFDSESEAIFKNPWNNRTPGMQKVSLPDL